MTEHDQKAEDILLEFLLRVIWLFVPNTMAVNLSSCQRHTQSQKYQPNGRAREKLRG